MAKAVALFSAFYEQARAGSFHDLETSITASDFLDDLLGHDRDEQHAVAAGLVTLLGLAMGDLSHKTGEPIPSILQRWGLEAAQD